MSDLIKDFQLKFPDLVKQMKASDHHFSEKDINKFHQESDVWTHSNMTCLIAEQRKCSDVVKLAILLHDIGKPMSRTVKEEEKKVRFFGHEGISSFMALDYLKTLSLNQEEISKIVQLISFHTLLYKSMRTEGYESELAKKFLGEHSLFSDLIEVTACDALGRFMDGDEQRDLWNNAQDYFAPVFFKIADFQERKTKGEALILVGPPMSGKSTWIEKNKKDHIVLSRDNVIMELSSAKTYSEAYKNVDQSKVDSRFDLLKKDALSTGNNLIFDLTNMSEKARRKALNGISKEMKRVAVVFLTGYNTLLIRNEERSRKEGKEIPQAALKQLLGAFEFPLRSEGFDEIKVIIS